MYQGNFLISYSTAADDANTVKLSQSGNLLFLSGHLPATVDGDLIMGKVGKDLTAEEGQKAAERVGLSILATLDNELGDLNKVKRIVKLVGFVNCVDGFEQQPFVINGCSDLMAR